MPIIFAAKAEAQAELVQMDAEAARDAADLVRVEGNGMIEADELSAGDAVVEAEMAYLKYEIGVSQRIGKVANNVSDLARE